MKVKVKRMGYMFNRRVQEGEVIVLENDELFSESWMEKLPEDSKETTVKKKEKKVKPVPLSQAAKANESFEEDDKPTGSKEVI